MTDSVVTQDNTTANTEPPQQAYFDAEFEFNAPRHCDFSNPDDANSSVTSAWFFTEEAAQLEKLNPLGLDLSAISPISTPMSNISIRTPSTDGSQTSKKLCFSEKKMVPPPQFKSVAKLTIPKSPHLLTSQRCQQHRRKSIVKSKLEEAKKFGHTHIGKYHYSLHSKSVLDAGHVARASLPPNKPKTTTFALRTDARATRTIAPGHKSTHEVLEQLRRELPSRFKSKPDPVKPEKINLEPTKVKEFWLRSHTRTRPKTVKSRKSMEKEIIEKARFKAKPFKPSVIQQAGQIGVPRVEKKMPTKVQEFALSKTNKRTREEALDDDEDQRPAKKTKLTHNASVIKPDQHASMFKARPMPVLTEPFKVRPAQAPLTEPHEFVLRTEIRGQAYQEKFKHQVEEERAKEAEMRHFVAKPITTIYDESHVQHPANEKPQLTKPNPFSLLSLARHEAAVEKMKANLAREEQERKQHTVFKAYDMPLHNQPFVPKRSEVPLTEVKEFNFSLLERSLSRAAFNKKEEERRNKLAEEKKRQREEAEKLEKQRIAEENKHLQFRARPLPSFYASQQAPTTASLNTTKAIQYR